MKKVAIIFILALTLILNSTIYASTFKDYNYEILCPNLFLNNDNLADSEIIKKIDDSICFYEKNSFHNFKYYENSIEYKNRTNNLYNYSLELEYSKDKVLEAVKVVVDKKDIKTINIIKSKDLKNEIMGPDVYKFKKGWENAIYHFLKSYRINSYESRIEPFKKRVYLVQNNTETLIESFNNFKEGKYNLIIKATTLLGRELYKNVKLLVSDEKIKIYEARNDVKINLDKRRPHEDIILNMYKDILKSRKIYVKEVYIENTNYKDFDKSGNTNFMNVIYKDDKNILYKDIIEINKDSITKVKNKNLKALYLTIFLLGFIFLGVGYNYLFKFIRNKIDNKKKKSSD